MMVFETYRQETDASSEIKDRWSQKQYIPVSGLCCSSGKHMLLAGSNLSRSGYRPKPWYFLRFTCSYLSLSGVYSCLGLDQDASP